LLRNYVLPALAANNLTNTGSWFMTIIGIALTIPSPEFADATVLASAQVAGTAWPRIRWHARRDARFRQPVSRQGKLIRPSIQAAPGSAIRSGLI